MSAEVVGLDQSIAYAQHVAEQATAHGTDGNEGYLARLTDCRVTGDGLSTAALMQEAFAAAAAAATVHMRELEKQRNVQEAYDVTPDAGDKTYLTGAGDGPAATATVSVAAVGAPDERSVRDRLARGAYIAQTARPDWQRDLAREWDAGNVDAEHRDVAYARADRALALWEQAGAGNGRLAEMRDRGIHQCPSWCQQDDDEHEHEAHRGRPLAFTTEDGDTVVVRPQIGWWSADPDVEVTLSGPSTSDGGTVVLTGRDLDHLQTTRREVLDSTVTAAVKPAYPGADAQAADADYPVAEPDAAAAALNMQARAGGYTLTENSDDPGLYLDWSTRPAAGIRSLEVSDGETTVGIDLTTAQLQDLHDGLGHAINGHDDDPGQVGDDDTYIDWSVVVDGLRCIEFGDGVNAVQLDLTDDQVRELHERLALQLRLDQQDAVR